MARGSVMQSLIGTGVIIAVALVAAGEVLVVPEEAMMVPVEATQLSGFNAPGQDNIWNGAEMGTDSIFMHRMSSKDADQSRQAHTQQPQPYAPRPGQNADDAWRAASPFTGTNSVFFGANGGGNGWAAPPQSLYGETAGGWSTAGHRPPPQDPKHLGAVPHLDGTNFAFNGADGYHFGWARKAGAGAAVAPAEAKKHAARKQAAVHKSALYGESAGSWSTAGHEAHPRDSKHIGSVPHLGGTNFAFNGADGYHFGWARKAGAGGAVAGRKNKDAGVKQVHKAHPKLGWNF